MRKGKYNEWQTSVIQWRTEEKRMEWNGYIIYPVSSIHELKETEKSKRDHMLFSNNLIFFLGVLWHLLYIWLRGWCHKIWVWGKSAFNASDVLSGYHYSNAKLKNYSPWKPTHHPEHKHMTPMLKIFHGHTTLLLNQVYPSKFTVKGNHHMWRRVMCRKNKKKCISKAAGDTNTYIRQIKYETS